MFMAPMTPDYLLTHVDMDTKHHLGDKAISDEIEAKTTPSLALM